MPSVSASNSLGATLKVLAEPVEVAAASAGAFEAAIDEQTLRQGDSVRTGTGGLALLTFFDGSETQLGGESQVQIEQADGTTAPQIAFLQTAGITVNHVIPMPPGGTFRTDTPAATGLVRGTSYIVVVGQAGTCGASGDQACTASMILLTDRNGHVGRVDVTPNDASEASVQLTSAGDAAAASRSAAIAGPIDPVALTQLEAVAHVRDDPAASLATDAAAHAIAATLVPLVAASGPDTSAHASAADVPTPEPGPVSPAVTIEVVSQAPAAPAEATGSVPVTPATPPVAPAPPAARSDDHSGASETADGLTGSAPPAVPGAASALSVLPSPNPAPAAHADPVASPRMAAPVGKDDKPAASSGGSPAPAKSDSSSGSSHSSPAAPAKSDGNSGSSHSSPAAPAKSDGNSGSSHSSPAKSDGHSGSSGSPSKPAAQTKPDKPAKPAEHGNSNKH